MDSVHFSLFFSSSKPISFQSTGPRERAAFLWSLLQVCAERLNRAPPVVRLRLLDLQQLALNTDDNDQATSKTQSTRASEHSEESVRQSSERAHLVQSLDALEISESLPESITCLSGGRQITAENSRSQTLSMSHGRRMVRTMSEPKIASAPKPVEVASLQAGSFDTKARLIRSADRKALHSAAMRRESNKWSGEHENGKPENISKADSDPKVRLFQNRPQASNANTARVVAQRRQRQERKRFRLDVQEQKNIGQTLDQFIHNHKELSHGFGSWIDTQIQELEAENFADLLCVEKGGGADCNAKSAPKSGKRELEGEDDKAQRMLKDSLTSTEQWFEKFEPALARYAVLAQDVNHEITLVNVRRYNAEQLETHLKSVLDVVCLSDEEKQLMGSLCTEELSLEQNEQEAFERAVGFVFGKGKQVKDMKVTDMHAVISLEEALVRRRANISRLLLGVLKHFVTTLYEGRDPWKWELRLTQEGEGMGFAEFRKWTKWLVECDESSLRILMDHVVVCASKWALNVLRCVLQSEENRTGEEISLGERARLLGATLLYLSCMQGRCLHLLFESVEDWVQDDVKRSWIERVVSGDVGGDMIEEYCNADYFTVEGLEETVENHSCMQLYLGSYLEWMGRRMCELDEDELQKQVSTGAKHCMVTDEKKVVRLEEVEVEWMSLFVGLCRHVASACVRMVDRYVGEVIDGLTVCIDGDEDGGRKELFSRVKQASDLCWQLLQARYILDTESAGVCAKRRGICQRVMTAAMGSVEVCSKSCSEEAGYRMKLQCYGYMCMRGGGDEESCIQLSNLCRRVVKHVARQWSAIVFERVLGNGILEEDWPVGSYAGMREDVMEMNGGTVCRQVVQEISGCMEAAGNTVAMVAVYDEVIRGGKERMEDVLRRVRRDKALSDVRPKLLLFSRELVGGLRAEMKKTEREVEC